MQTGHTDTDWGFTRQPFWLFSHLFAATVIVSFVGFGFWQLDRLNGRQASNDVIEARMDDTLVLDRAPQSETGLELDYRAAEAEVRFVEVDLGRVVNRSNNGIAGEHVVAIAELPDGSVLAVNRGFVPIGLTDPLDPLPTGTVQVSGWLRATVEQGGFFGADDLGTGRLLPRFDTDAIAARLDRDLPPVWLQLATIDGEVPGPVGTPEALDLPPLDDGPHLSYAVQWFIFASLGVAFYGALLRRRASGHRTTVTVAADEDPPADRTPGRSTGVGV